MVDSSTTLERIYQKLGKFFGNQIRKHGVLECQSCELYFEFSIALEVISYYHSINLMNLGL